MKTLIKILILTVVFYMSYTLVVLAQSTPSAETPAQGQENQENQENQQGSDLNITDYDSQDLEDDDSLYLEDSVTRKLSLRDLPPLKKKEKIIWSFRMAETNSFL